MPFRTLFSENTDEPPLKARKLKLPLSVPEPDFDAYLMNMFSDVGGINLVKSPYIHFLRVRYIVKAHGEHIKPSSFPLSIIRLSLVSAYR